MKTRPKFYFDVEYIRYKNSSQEGRNLTIIHDKLKNKKTDLLHKHKTGTKRVMKTCKTRHKYPWS